MIKFLTPLLVSVAFASEGGGEHAAEGGIPWVPIAFHAMNLVILLIIIARYAGPTIKDSIVGRAARIRKDLESSAELHRDAQQRYAALTARLDGFDGELKAMRAQAEEEATKEREEIIARAGREARVIEEATQRTIRSELAKARTELRQESVQIAMRIAEQRLRGQLRADDEERFASDFLRAVKEVPNG